MMAINKCSYSFAVLHCQSYQQLSQMLKISLLLLCIARCITTTVASETCYIVGPSLSQSQHWSSDVSNNSNSQENRLLFSQFTANASDYLTSDTRLLFLPGNYSLKSELIIENVRSFSMWVWPNSLSKVVIILCSHNARFEFKNVSTITMNGFKFIRCFQNHVQSVD